MKVAARLGAAGAALLAAGPCLADNYVRVNGIISPTFAWEDTWREVLTDLFIIGGIFAVFAAWLLIRFRANTPGQTGTAKPLTLNTALAWSLVPAAIFMADDFLLAAKGWSLWDIQRAVPANAMEVSVYASQWSFEFDYGNGIKTGELVVPVGQPVVLRLHANDVTHSFGLIEYRLKEDIIPGRINHLWFIPDKPLETFVTCVEFCGDGHANMNAAVKAVPKADFDAWLASKKKKAAVESHRYASLAVDPAL